MFKSIGSGISSAFGAVSEFSDLFNDDDEDANKTGNGAKVISPQDRVARSIEEQRTTNNAEITIKSGDGTTAELTNGKLGKGLSLQSSGSF